MKQEESMTKLKAFYDANQKAVFAGGLTFLSIIILYFVLTLLGVIK